MRDEAAGGFDERAPTAAERAREQHVVRYVGRELAELLSVSEVVDALARAFGGEPTGSSPLRTSVTVPRGELLIMPAFGEAGLGVKLVVIAPENPARGLPLIDGLFVLFSEDTLRPELVVDGAALTTLRTGAVSALVARHLAREDASRLVVFGAGVQAAAHVDAMCSVRAVERVSIVAPTNERAGPLVAALRARGIDAQRSDPAAVRSADLICTCTTSTVPVFRGAEVAPGAHVTAVGAYRPDMREVDGDLLARATVVVDSREAALAEAGDVLIALEEGALEPSQIVGEIQDVVTGRVSRRTKDEITVFKSVGFAFEDLVVAHAVYERLVDRGGS